MNLLQQVMVHILTQETLCVSLLDWDDKTIIKAVNTAALDALSQIHVLIHDQELSPRERLMHVEKTLNGIGIHPTLHNPRDGF